MTSSLYTGQCLCGSVRYEADQLGPKMAHCHCSMCRKFHGAAFATFGSARREDFRWIAGADLLHTYTAPNGTTRSFCSQCGSSMTFAPAGHSDWVEFTLGTLDTPLGRLPDAHIYVDSKADWDVIADGLPCFGEGRV